MWPKAIGQLVELAPHITRLLPLADRFLKDKASNDESLRQVLEQQRAFVESQRAGATNLNDRLHADLEAISSAQQTQVLTLQRQFTELEQQVISTRGDALAAKKAAESLTGQLGKIEEAQRGLRTLVSVALALLALLTILAAVALLRGH